MSPTVYVVDDDASVRTAIARLLQSVDLSCELFSSAGDFLERAEKGVDGCAILDVRMPGITGLDLQRALSTLGAEIPIVFVTAYADVALTVRAMKAGALEVLTKPFDDQALLDVVHAALAKSRVRQQERELTSRLRRLYGSLTPREREVMNFVAAGLPNKRIAGELGTTEGTVKAHRAQVMRKMQVESLADLVRAADRLELPRTNLHQES
jgi:FixJ family two-component response regulator